MSRVQSVNGFFNKGYNKLKQFSTSPYTGWGKEPELEKSEWRLERIDGVKTSVQGVEYLKENEAKGAIEYEKGELKLGNVYDLSKIATIDYRYYAYGFLFGSKKDSSVDPRKPLGYAIDGVTYQHQDNAQQYRENINCLKRVLTPILFPATVITLSLAVVAALIMAALHLLSVIPAAAADCCLTDDEDNTENFHLN